MVDCVCDGVCVNGDVVCDDVFEGDGGDDVCCDVCFWCVWGVGVDIDVWDDCDEWYVYVDLNVGVWWVCVFLVCYIGCFEWCGCCVGSYWWWCWFIC